MPGTRSAAARLAPAVVLFTALIGCGTAHGQGAAAPVWPTRQWQISTPEQQGMDSAALAKLLAFGTSRSLDSLLIARHGRIVLDAYYAPYTSDIPHAVNSSTKAVVGTLAAIAYKEGLLDSYDHQMLDFFGDRTIANLDDRKKAITVQNLLDMTSGLEWEEGISGGREQSLADWSRSSNLVQFVLDSPMAHDPGEVFYYDSGNPHLVSAIITKLTGMKASDYAAAKLFGPLGIAKSYWRQDPQGISTGGGGLFLLPRDNVVRRPYVCDRRPVHGRRRTAQMDAVVRRRTADAAWQGEGWPRGRSCCRAGGAALVSRVRARLDLTEPPC